jgi:hypothetical protein
MRDLRGIDCDLMKPQQKGQALQARILARGLHSHQHYLKSSQQLLHAMSESQNQFSVVSRMKPRKTFAPLGLICEEF